MAKTAAGKGQKRRTGRKQTKTSMWPWYLAGVLSVSAVLAYDHRAQILPITAPFYTASIGKPRPVEKQSTPEKRAGTTQPSAKPALAMPAMRPVGQAAVDVGALKTIDEQKTAGRKPGTFYFCTETLENCVVDGGTFWYGRRKIQIADIQAPKIKQAKCDDERKLGSLAKKRLWEILNAGEVQLAGVSGQNAQVTVGQGRSIGDMLVSEGLARRPSGGKQGWCAQG
jgi:endonuclease YncB( thermonuclease family)